MSIALRIAFKHNVGGRWIILNVVYDFFDHCTCQMSKIISMIHKQHQAVFVIC